MLDLATDVQQGPISASDDNGFAYLAFAFLAKQKEYMKGVLTLVEAGLYRDAGLIVRSMLEGRAQLLWASKKPEERARQWQEFWPVSDWRKLNKSLKAGRSVSPDLQVKIDQGRSDLKDKFLTQNGRERLKKGRTLRSKDHWDNWTGHSYSELLDSCVSEPGENRVQEHDLKLLVYSPLSAWHHWDIGGFVEAIRREQSEGVVTYRHLQPDCRPGAEALAVAFQCLFQTLLAADRPLALEIEEKLESLLSDYLENFGDERRK